MVQGAAYQDRVLTHLNALTPEARALLHRSLKQNPAASPEEQMRALMEAARAFPKPGAVIPDVTKSKERFFEPFRPFVIDEELPTKQQGLISRESLDGIWAYLVREVLPEAFVPWTQTHAVTIYGSEQEVWAALKALRNAAFAELTRLDRDSEGDHKARQRFVSRMGGERAHADFRDMLALMDRLSAIDRFMTRLPANIVFGDVSERLCFDHIYDFISDRPEDTVWIGAALFVRVSPMMLIRAAGAVAGSTHPADIRRTPAACFVDLALAAIERSIVRYFNARQDPNEINALVAEIRHYHETVRAVESAIEFEHDAIWRMRLAALRTTMSDLIAADIEAMIPCVRRALQISDTERPNATDAFDAIRATSILVAARWNKDSLALNELIMRVQIRAEQTIEVLGNRLMDRLRRSHGTTRSDVVAASDTLIRITDLMFGEEHAAILRRSRDRAIASRTGLTLAG